MTYLLEQFILLSNPGVSDQKFMSLVCSKTFDSTDCGSIRDTSLYPASEMEMVYLHLMGIEDDCEEIERQKVIAKESNIDWLIYLREVSEEVQLLSWAGVARVNRKSIY